MSEVEIMLNLYKKQLADSNEQANLYKAQYLKLHEQYEKLKTECQQLRQEIANIAVIDEEVNKDE